MPTAATFSRTASSMEVVTPSSARSPAAMLVPPDTRSISGLVSAGFNDGANHAAGGEQRVGVGHQRRDSLAGPLQVARRPLESTRGQREGTYTSRPD